MKTLDGTLWRALPFSTGSAGFACRIMSASPRKRPKVAATNWCVPGRKRPPDFPGHYRENKRCCILPCIVPCFLPCTCLSERYIQTAFIGTVLEPVRRNEHRYRCRRATVLLGAASYRLSGV